MSSKLLAFRLAALAVAAFAAQHSLSFGGSDRVTSAWKRTKCGPADQVTQWGAALDPNNVLPEYPRPQLTRDPSTARELHRVWSCIGPSAADAPMQRCQLGASNP
jgi:hypothetical protein